MTKITAKKILLVVFYHILLLIAVLIFIFKYAEEVTQIKADIYYQFQISDTVDTNVDFSDYPAFEPEENLWINQAQLIHHAGGGIDGLDYSNSREALENTLSGGERYIEIDFMYTSDHHLVCMHKWAEQWGSETPPTLQEFISGNIYGKYSPMTASDLIQYMDQYSDLYIIIDTKESDYVNVIRDLVELSFFNPSITDRFIIQIYDSGAKAEILQLYSFSDSNFLFTAYKFGSRFPNKIMNICYDENIYIVTVPYGDWDQETIDLYRSKNIIIYEHTMNRPDQANEELRRGVHGLYTDFLSSEDLEL